MSFMWAISLLTADMWDYPISIIKDQRFNNVIFIFGYDFNIW